MAMVHCFAATDVGHVRTSNEDCYATSGGVERDRWSGELDPMRGWALVADGMGAHAAGEVASGIALDGAARPRHRSTSIATSVCRVRAARART